jgi:hypothetical protein
VAVTPSTPAEKATGLYGELVAIRDRINALLEDRGNDLKAVEQISDLLGK